MISTGESGEDRLPEVDVPRDAAASPEAVVRFLVGELAATCSIPADHVEQVVAEVFRREALGSTAFGGGIALPHTRSDAVKQLGVLVGLLPVPLDWHALDAAPVCLVCLVLSPRSNPGPRPRHLENLVRTLLDRRDRL